MGNTRDTGYLRNLVTYDGSGNITLPANLTVTGTITGYATQSYVTTQISNLVNGAPGLLDTLDELAAALGDDANFAATLTTSLSGKQASLSGTGFVKISGTTISYDNSTYLTTSSAASTYLPLTGGTVASAPASSTANVLTIRNSNASDNGYANSVLALDTVVSGAAADIRLGSSNPLAIRIYASTTPLTVSPTGAGFQMFTNTSPSFPGHMYFDSGANNSAALNFRTAVTGGNITTRLKIEANGTIKLSMLTSNGFVKTSGSDGSLSIDTNTYLTTASATSTYLPLAGGTLTGVLTSTSTAPLSFQSNSNTGTYNPTIIYFNQNNTSANTANGVFIERGRLTDSASAEVRYFVIGARGGTIQWQIDGSGNTTQTGTLTGTSATLSGALTVAGNVAFNNYVVSDVSFADGYKLMLRQPSMSIDALKASYFGYSSGYGVLIVGHTGANNRSLSFGVDVSGNPSGAFSGWGSEYIWRGTASFITPNTSNNGYNTLLSWNTSGQMTFNQTVTIGTAVAATNVKLLLNGVASKAAGIEFQQNGTAQWYIGNGIASEDNNFELYNSNGNMAMKIIKSTNAINFIGTLTATGTIRSINGGVDASYQDAFVGVYSSNNNEQNAIQTSVSSVAASSGFRFQVSNGGGSSLRTTMMTLTRSNLSVSNEVIVGAQGGTDTTYISGGSGYGSVIRNIYAGGSVNNELRGNGNNYFNVLLGSMGVGTNNPQYTLDVNGSGRFVGALYANNTIYGTRIIGGNLIAGNMASNMPTSPSYILIVNINDIAGFSMSGKVNAASYTCWNISDIWIEKDYSSTVVRAGIEGKYKSGCDFSIVDISYGAGRYVAFRFTSNPEVDVLLTGYRLTDQVSGGSFQVITSGVTVNGTYASY